MVRWNYLVSSANRFIDELDDKYGVTVGRTHWVVSAQHAKRAMAASAAAVAVEAVADRAAFEQPVPADLEFNSFRYVDADGNRVRYYAEQRGTVWVLMREMGGARTKLDYMEASVGRCVEDALGERACRYSESVTRTTTPRRWQAMTGGRVQWAEEGQEETDVARREKRWAALPHLHTPWRGPSGRRRRPRPPPPSTAAARADAEAPSAGERPADAGRFGRRCGGHRRLSLLGRAADGGQAGAAPPPPPGDGPATGGRGTVQPQQAGRRTAAYRTTMPGASPRPIQPRARAGMRHRQPPPRGGRR